MPALLSYPARAADFTIEAKNVAGTTEQYVEVTWPAEVNWLYFAEASETIEEGSWQYLPEAIVGAPDTLGVLRFYPERPEEPDTRFLRVIRTTDLGGDGMSQDNDSDDLINQDEFDNLTDPLDPDTDDDGLLDGFEVHNGLDPLDDGTGDINNGPQGDPDGDGWTNLQEQAAGTNPKNRDTDGDGRADNEDPTPTQNDAIADPDGAGLDSSLNTSLIGRWDFEVISNGFPSSPAATGPCNPAGGAGWLPFSGVVSHAGDFGSTGLGHFEFPTSVLHGRNTVTFSQWLRLPPNALASVTSRMDILGVGKAWPGHLQTPLFTAYFTATGKIKLESQWINYPAVTQLGEWTVPPQLDDGRYHHLVLVKAADTYSIYVDSELLGAPIRSNNVSFQLDVAPYHYLGLRDPFSFGTALKGQLDRVRIYGSALSLTAITALYNQDIDRDQLFDRTEGQTLLWRDLDGNGQRGYLNYQVLPGGGATVHPEEGSFRIDPFHWDDPDSDHDHDGLTSLAEQNVTFTNPAHPDSDGDRLSDGWEVSYGLDPLDPSDGGISTDTDGDGLSNLDEFMNGTNPNLPDSDGDLVNDVPEIAQGSDPNDASDGGQAPAAEEILELRLGIGDESGSESEDYHLVCYEYDSASFSEREVFRLVSGGHGQYQEKTSKIFRKWHSYTFKIEWQSSSLGTGAPGSGDGPDYDYTMKVEPVIPDILLTFTDSFDPATGYAEPGYQLLGEQSNVQNFEYISNTKRVLSDYHYIDLAVDTNLDRKLESLPDGVPPGNSWLPDKSVKDRELENGTPPRPTVIDVNNNNTDSGDSQSDTADEVDNRNATLDTEADREEHTTLAEGHTFARLRIWANATNKYGIPWKGGGEAEVLLRLRLPDAGDDEILRVYSWEGYQRGEEPGDNRPVVLLGPGKISHDFDNPAEFFAEGNFGPGRGKHDWKRDLFMEGLTYGTECGSN